MPRLVSCSAPPSTRFALLLRLGHLLCLLSLYNAHDVMCEVCFDEGYRSVQAQKTSGVRPRRVAIRRPLHFSPVLLATLRLRAPSATCYHILHLVIHLMYALTQQMSQQRSSHARAKCVPIWASLPNLIKLHLLRWESINPFETHLTPIPCEMRDEGREDGHRRSGAPDVNSFSFFLNSAYAQQDS